MIKIILTLMLLANLTLLQAAVITVNKGGDTRITNDGGCDLREAVLSAFFNDFTTFDGCTQGNENTTDFIIINVAGPIQLEDKIDVNSAVSISPPIGSSNRVKIIAASGKRIFEVQPFSEDSNDFQMINLHLMGGDAGSNDGGAIQFYRFQSNNLGSIYIGDSIFEDNSGRFGGAIAFDETYATSVTLLRNEFIQNNANVGGALSADRASNGEFKITLNKFELNNAVNQDLEPSGGAAFIIDSNDSLYSIVKNQFIENSSEGSAGALDIRGFNANQDFLLEKNVFLYNEADSYAGGLSVGEFGMVELYNSTFAYNSASRGGGLVYINGRINIRSSTVVYNSATISGQNIYSYGGNGNIRRSIIAYAGTGNNCAGDFSNISPGSSSVMDDMSCPFDVFFDIEADPMLSVLDNHSSGLFGFSPLAGSSAIDTIEQNFCRNYDDSFMLEDQQGNPRPIDSDSDGNVYCDSGAIEAPVYTNQAAVANNDSPTAILEDSNAVIIDVLTNDTDSEGDNFVVIAKTNGTHGVVTITNSGLNVSYEPDENYCGTDTFTYTITGNDSATVNIQVTCVNDAPSFLVNKDIYIGVDQIGSLQPQLIACHYNFGPGEENSQQTVSNILVNINSDSDGIINSLDVSNDGFMIPVFSGNQGMATVTVTLFDNAGILNNGENSSNQMVNIHVRDYIFRNSMEIETCL